jgi:stress response protein YsnF
MLGHPATPPTASDPRGSPIAPATTDLDRDRREPLPLEARVERTLAGVTVHLPVRAEQVAVEKQPVIVEEVVVSAARITEIERFTDTVRREELEVDTEGELETIEQPAAGDQPAWQGVRRP